MILPTPVNQCVWQASRLLGGKDPLFLQDDEANSLPEWEHIGPAGTVGFGFPGI